MGLVKNMNAQISGNFQGIDELVISVDDLRCSALSPGPPGLEHGSQRPLQPCRADSVPGWM